MAAKTHTTALVLIPPQDVWPAIQAIRQQHDHNVRRWMPHITLLYPFAPKTECARVVSTIAAVCDRVAPFTLTLTRFGVFGHGRRGATLYLVPEPPEPLGALQTMLWQALPVFDDTRRHEAGFTPHLSVGQCANTAAARTLGEQLAAAWQPVSFLVDFVHLLARSTPPDDTFAVAESIRCRGTHSA